MRNLRRFSSGSSAVRSGRHLEHEGSKGPPGGGGLEMLTCLGEEAGAPALGTITVTATFVNHLHEARISSWDAFQVK